MDKVFIHLKGSRNNMFRKRERFLKKGGTVRQNRDILPVMSLYSPTLNGSMSERMVDLLWDYMEHNPNWLLHNTDDAKLDPKGILSSGIRLRTLQIWNIL